MGLRPVFRSASWQEYEGEFISALRRFKKEGIETGVFGDIDVDAHREWVRRVCAIAEIEPVHPLWQRNRRELLEEFIGLGFKAQIVVINEQKLDKGFLGKIIQTATIAEMEEAEIDPSGEAGGVSYGCHGWPHLLLQSGNQRQWVNTIARDAELKGESVSAI